MSMTITIDRALFETIYSLLNLTKPVNLAVSVEPPEGLVKSILGGNSSPQEDPKIKAVDSKTVLDAVAGAYGPKLIGKTEEIEEHCIWVRPTRGMLEASVSLVHEMIHASQMESFGVKVYHELDAKWMNDVGYEGNPFEVEAENMSRFITHDVGLIFYES